MQSESSGSRISIDLRTLPYREGGEASRHVISKLENGKGGAHPVIIRKLAKALDADPTELEGK